MSTRTAAILTFVFLLVPATLVWAQPSPRGYVDMVYVPQVEKVLLMGGEAGFMAPHEAVGGSWWYDPAADAWSEAVTEPTPSPRAASNMAVHAPTGTVVMFGGGVPTEGGFEPYDETWLFDPIEERWTRLEFEDGAAPEAEIGEMFAYHEASDTFVLYGGFTLDRRAFLDATWHFDLEARTWTRVEPDTVPRGRNYNTFAYDPRTERLVMTGGPETPDATDEVWTYDPREATWRQHERVPVGEVTPYARMVFDTVTGQLIRFGGHREERGTAWALSADLDWTLLEPEGDAPRPISRHAMAAVPGLGVLIFGGVPRSRLHERPWLLDTNEMRWIER